MKKKCSYYNTLITISKFHIISTSGSKDEHLEAHVKI